MVSFGDAFKSNNSDLITAQVIDAIANFFSERQINISGTIPTCCKSRIVFCVGFVFNSFVAGRNNRYVK